MGRPAVNVTVDTDVLIRAAVEDDAEQASVAQSILARASLIAVPIPVFCELVWVLRRGYRRSAADIAALIERLLEVETLVTDVAATEAGLAVLRAGGDFADGAIAWQGQALGGTTYVSFDRDALAHWRARGGDAVEPV
jgi:predicted nucleic-acid-binding protein